MNCVRVVPRLPLQNKAGWVWGRNALEDRNEWSITLRFRVSGSQQTLFGDGFALWVTQDAYYNKGDLHGFSDRFVGFGVIFDTYVNTGAGHVHKDVAVLWNDGSESKMAPHGGIGDPNAPGCDSKFRYHAGRADFNAATARSTAVISYKNGMLSVRLDPKNSGELVSCVEEFTLPLPADWVKTAHIGLTATTGELADNHDVLSMELAVGVGAARADATPDKLPGTSQDLQRVLTGKPRIDQAVQRASEMAAETIDTKMDALKHELEHELDSVSDHLKVLIKKVQDAEKIVEDRVKTLEDRLSKLLDEKVGSAIAKGVDDQVRQSVGKHVDSTVAQRVGEMAETLHDKVSGSVKDMVREYSSGIEGGAQDDEDENSSFFTSTSFLQAIIVLLFFAVAFIGYQTHLNRRDLRKSHLP